MCVDGQSFSSTPGRSGQGPGWIRPRGDVYDARAVRLELALALLASIRRRLARGQSFLHLLPHLRRVGEALQEYATPESLAAGEAIPILGDEPRTRLQRRRTGSQRDPFA